MPTYIALLRGINVGGHKKMPMEPLREFIEQLGFKGVKSYIQSGNIVFNSKLPATDCQEIIKAGILEHYGWEVPVFVIKPAFIKDIISQYSLTPAWLEQSYFTVLLNTPSKAGIQELLALNYPGEHIAITNNCLYFYCENGYGRAKLNSATIERKLKVSTTTRNYRTLVRLLALAS